MELVPGLGASAQPKQLRSRESHERLVAAARELLVEQGGRALTVAEVSSRAGVAVGTLYGRFGDKTGLLRVVHRAEVDAINATVLPGLQALREDLELSPEKVIDGAVRLVVAVFCERTAVVREFFLMSTREGLMQSDGSAQEAPIADAFRELLCSRCAVASPTPVRAADMCCRVIVAACVYRATYGPSSESHMPLDWDSFTEEMVRMCRTYLLSPAD
jgi:AcrR family transcriptional regulator